MGDENPASHRPFSPGWYLFVVFGLSWPFQIAGALRADSLPARFTLMSISMMMVAIGTFLCGRYIFRDGFGGAGWNWGRSKHYLAVIGLALLLYAVPSLIAVSLGRSAPSSLSNEQLVWMFLLLFGTLLPAFGEEFGWRGYMLPRLARRHSIRKAILLHAVIWWIWHLPVSVGTIAHAPWKVVWGRIGNRIEAAVISRAIPQETISLVACSDEQEAHYIAALVNSIPFQFAAYSYSQAGGKSFGSPHVLENICVPKFKSGDTSHQQLSQLSQRAHALAPVAYAGDPAAQAKLAQVEAEIDRAAARLWGLTEAELDGLRRALEELKGEDLSPASEEESEEEA